MALAEVRKRIDDHRESGSPEPLLLSVEEFFEGNDDPGSIGCNLMPHPGLARFHQVLTSVRERPDVASVLMSVTDEMSDDEWPFSDRVYVVTSAAISDVQSRLSALQPEPVEVLREVPPGLAGAIPWGMRALLVWWD